jgi:hypothetical protein
MKKIIFATLLAAYILLPHAASAASIFWDWGQPLLSCTGNDLSQLPPGQGGVTKHCSNFCDILETGQNLMRFGLTLALEIIAPLMFLTGGILIMISRGNAEQYKAGVQTMTGAAGGILIILIAFILVNTFFYLVSLNSSISGTLNAGSWYKIQCTVPNS